MTATDTTTKRPRTSTLDRPTLMKLAETEYDRFIAMLHSLDPQDWHRPTDCPAWDVRDMVGHCLGMAEMAASMREGMRQQKEAGKRGGVFIDALTAIQVEKNASLSTAELIAKFEKVGPKAAKARRRTPGFMRGMRMKPDEVINDIPEPWSMGFLLDTILTRDPWMHRMDIARATGVEPRLSADHDGVLVGDVVNEWGSRHREECELTLTGPAGGRWTFGSGGPSYEVDAIDFCRTASGRPPKATGLLATEVPF